MKSSVFIGLSHKYERALTIKVTFEIIQKPSGFLACPFGSGYPLVFLAVSWAVTSCSVASAGRPSPAVPAYHSSATHIANPVYVLEIRNESSNGKKISDFVNEP